MMDAEFLNQEFNKRNVLIVGDGDFSFSVAFYLRYQFKFVSTILEDGEVMLSKYPNYKENVKFLQLNGVTVLTGVDATKLEHSFKDEVFTHVVFNFPHVGGKSNIKKNRQLLEDFFMSVKTVTSDKSKILVTLCKGQGGTDADLPKREWCNSWQATAKAASSGFILKSVSKFEGKQLFEEYLSTGFRSQNKRFNTDNSLLHIFMKSLPQPFPGTVSKEFFPSESVSLTLFCDTLAQAWNIEFKGYLAEVPYKNADDIVLYSAMASFHLKLDGAELKPIHLNSFSLVIVDDKALLLSSAISDEAVEVGSIEKCTLRLDTIKSLSHIFSQEDYRYYLFDIAPLTITKDEEQTNYYICKERSCDSLYPPEYPYDISFWIGERYSVCEFLALVRTVSYGLVRSVKLLDKYCDPETGRQSRCYSLVYQCLDKALSCKQAYNFYQFLRNECGRVLDIELR